VGFKSWHQSARVEITGEEITGEGKIGKAKVTKMNF